MTQLPYTAVTSAGEAFDIRFPLHPETGSTQAVADLLTGVLGAISARVEAGEGVSDGDVLQALAMAMAVRAHGGRAAQDQPESDAWAGGRQLRGDTEFQPLPGRPRLTREGI